MSCNLEVFVSVDPGVHASGMAWWTYGKLAQVEYCKPGHNILQIATDLIIEVPQVYQGRAQKGDPNDLITLAVEVGRITTLFPNHRLVKPRDWKGNIKKEMMLKRIIKTLTTEELLMVKALKLPKSKVHNVLDALGIGLWYLGRLQ